MELSFNESPVLRRKILHSGPLWLTYGKYVLKTLIYRFYFFTFTLLHMFIVINNRAIRCQSETHGCCSFFIFSSLTSQQVFPCDVASGLLIRDLSLQTDFNIFHKAVL